MGSFSLMSAVSVGKGERVLGVFGSDGCAAM